MNFPCLSARTRKCTYLTNGWFFFMMLRYNKSEKSRPFPFQLIPCPTHILPNSSSCIDLIFTNQTNLLVESGVHSSLHPNCHHQIVFAKFNLNVFYPPLYERLVWRYHEAKKEQIYRAVNNFDWNRAFERLDVDAQIRLFNETIINKLCSSQSNCL